MKIRFGGEDSWKEAVWNSLYFNCLIETFDDCSLPHASTAAPGNLE